MKKICILIVSMLCLLTFGKVDINAAETGENIINISTEADLQKIVENPYGHYKLTNNIVLSGTGWEPLCGYEDATRFNGILDGNGYTISNLVTDKSLFSEIGTSGVVKNLTVSGTLTATPDGTPSMIALRSYGAISDCITTGSVKQIREYDGYADFTMAGMVAVNFGLIENCVNRADVMHTYVPSQATISLEGTTAGITAFNYGTILNCRNEGNVESYSMWIGGIAGYMVFDEKTDVYGSILNCQNSGTLTGKTREIGSNNYEIGGIVGRGNGILYNCKNSGTINTLDVDCGNKASGIIGSCQADSWIIKCENSAKLNVSTGMFGGIIGEAGLNDLISDKMKLYVSQCENSGEIESVKFGEGSAGIYAAGILGRLYDVDVAEILDCSNSGVITLSNNAWQSDSAAGIVAVGRAKNTGSEVLFKNLKNTAPITNENGEASGILGNYMTFDTDSHVVMENCRNEGELRGYQCAGVAFSSSCLFDKVSFCSNTGDIYGDDIYGLNFYGTANGILENCYNIGNVITEDDMEHACGIDISGFQSVLNVYTYGEIVASDFRYAMKINTNNQENCYYLKDDTLYGGTDGTPLEEAQMFLQSSYEGFDFSNVWEMKNQNGKLLPALKEKEPDTYEAAFSSADVSIMPNGTAQVAATAGKVLKYFSKNPSIVSVNDGTLTANAFGETEIFALFEGGEILSCKAIVLPADLAELNYSIYLDDMVEVPTYSFNNTSICPKVTVKINDLYLIEGKDFTVSYLDNINPGTATITITGKNAYTGVITQNFTIVDKLDISQMNPEIILLEDSWYFRYEYDGTEKCPFTRFTVDGFGLTSGEDFTVKYENNINAGTGTVIITGINDYKGTVTKEFTIKPANLPNTGIQLAKDSYAYTGNAIKPGVKLTTLNGETLKENKDYKVTYKNNTNVGTATVVVTGINNYKGSYETYFEIAVAKGSSYIVGNYKYKVTSDTEVAFTGLANTKVTKVVIPATVKIAGKKYKVTSIASKALNKKTKVTSVVIGNNVTEIGNSAFAGCSKLTSVTKGAKVTKIGTSAFSGCSRLTSITLGNKVTTIGKTAFQNCKKLGMITIKSTQLKTVGKNAFKGIKATAKIKVPAKKLNAYQKLMKNKGQGKKVKITK